MPSNYNMPPISMIHSFFDPTRFVTEFIYTLAIVILCYLIYHKTHEFFELTKHKGIKHFRNAFLFFGAAYLTRFIFLILNISTRSFEISLGWEIRPFSLVLTSYLSTMAIFYLAYSTIWKRIKLNHFILFSNIIAVSLSLIAFINRSHELLTLFQLVLLIFATVLSLSKKGKKFSESRILYLLILIFWLFSLFVSGPKRLLPIELRISFQIISIIVFYLIYYKVVKWIK